MNSPTAVRVTSGATEVIAAGTVIPFGESGDVAFQLGSPEKRIAVAIRFEDGPRVGSEPRFQVLPRDSRSIELVLRDNVGSASGEGTIKPLRLGVFDGHQLFVHFRVFRVGNAPRILHYTFFRTATLHQQLEALIGAAYE